MKWKSHETRRYEAVQGFDGHRFDPEDPQKSVDDLLEITARRVEVERLWYVRKARRRKFWSNVSVRAPIVILSAASGLLLSIGAIEPKLLQSILVWISEIGAPCPTLPVPAWTEKGGSLGALAGVIAGGFFAFDRFLMITSQYTIWRLVECRLSVRIAEYHQDYDRARSIFATDRIGPLQYGIRLDLSHDCIIDMLQEIQRETEAWRDRFTEELTRLQKDVQGIKKSKT